MSYFYRFKLNFHAVCSALYCTSLWFLSFWSCLWPSSTWLGWVKVFISSSFMSLPQSTAVKLIFFMFLVNQNGTFPFRLRLWLNASGCSCNNNQPLIGKKCGSNIDYFVGTKAFVKIIILKREHILMVKAVLF